MSWDWHEINFPRCAFGELGLKCTACLQGPCRINPFSEKKQLGVCGRKKESMIAENFARLVISGLDDYILDMNDLKLFSQSHELILWLNGGMNLPPKELLDRMIHLAGLVVSKASKDDFRQFYSGKISEKSEEKEKNKLILSEDFVVVILGKVPQDKIELLLQNKNIKIYSLLNEFPYQNISSIVNYGNQEFLFERKIPDFLVIGSGCCMPNIIHLAEKYSIPYQYYYDLTEDHVKKLAVLPPKPRKSLELFESVFSKPNLQSIKNQKIALIAGCNNIRQTHDEEISYLANYLLKNNYLILTSGCAALSIAKYFKEQRDRIFYLGSCFETVKYLDIFNQLNNKQEAIAVFSEISQPRILAVALGLAYHQIPTYITTKFIPIPDQSVISSTLKDLNKDLRINYHGQDIQDFIKL